MAVYAQSPDGRARRLDPLQLGLIAALLSLAALAWALTGETMAGMDMESSGEVGSLSFFLGAWVAMMAAMMLPAVAPMAVAYAARLRSRDAGRAVTASAGIVGFVCGYLLAWTAFGLLAYAIVESLRGLGVDAFSWDGGGRYLAAGVVLAAAVYQLTASKGACLSRCRDRGSLLADERRRGHAGGALRLGLEHGAWCVGCCWALMAALFALGAMSVAWMALIAALIVTERLSPWRVPVGCGVAALLLALSLAVALTDLV